MLVIAVASIYIFIPDKLEVSEAGYMNIASNIVYRNLSEKSKWSNWWPEKSAIAENTNGVNKTAYFGYNQISYDVISTSINAIEILILTDGHKLSSTVLIIPLKKDSTGFHWKCVMETGFNPFRKIQYYQQAKMIKKNMTDIFESLQSFLAKKENIYSIPIERSTVTDTFLLTTKVITTQRLPNTEIYRLINSLKKYIADEGAKETGYPMLHVLKADSNLFQTMVAIPVGNEIKNKGDFIFKRMVPGNILVAEIKGGDQSIEKAFNEMEIYLTDHQLTQPAIPFQSLVTNRINEPDTTRWITRLYYPVL